MFGTMQLPKLILYLLITIFLHLGCKCNVINNATKKCVDYLTELGKKYDVTKFELTSHRGFNDIYCGEFERFKEQKGLVILEIGDS